RHQQPPGDLGVLLGELAPVAAQEGKLAFVMWKQVLHRAQAACPRMRLTEYCSVVGCSIASKLTGSRAGCRSSSAWMVKCSPPPRRPSESRRTCTPVSRGSWRPIACSSERQISARSYALARLMDEKSHSP